MIPFLLAVSAIALLVALASRAPARSSECGLCGGQGWLGRVAPHGFVREECPACLGTGEGGA